MDGWVGDRWVDALVEAGLDLRVAADNHLHSGSSVCYC